MGKNAVDDYDSALLIEISIPRPEKIGIPSH
jgi:hypothetical protein